MHADRVRGSAPCGGQHRKFIPLMKSWFSSLDRIKMEICHQYRLVIQVTNGTVLNKLQSYYSQIFNIRPRSLYQLSQESDVYFMSMACGRPQVSWAQRRGTKNLSSLSSVNLSSLLYTNPSCVVAHVKIKELLRNKEKIQTLLEHYKYWSCKRQPFYSIIHV